MRTIILTAILAALATPAQALTLADLTPEIVSIPDNTPRKQAWLDRYCPSNRWIVAEDGSEIYCVEVDVSGTGTTRSLQP